jgi:hypothetical protein
MSTTPKSNRTTHAPGPWSVNSQFVGPLQIKDANGEPIAYIDDIPNAELIAAAPEMLAALRKVPLFGPTEDNLGWRCAGCGSVSGINPDGTDREEECADDCYVPIIEAAIAKAEGK